MSKLAQLMFGAMVAANIGITAAPAAAQVGGASAQTVQSGSIKPADGRGGDRSGRGYRSRGGHDDYSGSKDRPDRGYHYRGGRDDYSGSEGRSERAGRDIDRRQDRQGYRNNDRGHDGDRWRGGFAGGYGGRNGSGYPAPAYSYGGYRDAPRGYRGYRGYHDASRGYDGYHHAPRGYGRGPAPYAGWANAGFYAPVVALPLPAYRGWGVGYGYAAAPVVVVVAPPAYGWAHRGRRGR